MGILIREEASLVFDRRRIERAMLVSVAVPEGVDPGDEFEVILDERDYRVVCPEGVCAGALLELEIDEPQSIDTERPACVEVAVPEGVAPGESFVVELEDGTINLSVQAPIDCVDPAGMLLYVEVSECPSTADVMLSNRRSESGARECHLSSESWLCDDYSSSESGRRTGRYSSELPLLEPCCVAESGISHGVPAWNSPAKRQSWIQPRCGRFFYGQRVDVYRSNGTWSQADVIDHEVMGDTYTVQLPSGQCKFFVEFEDLSAVRAGAYEVGRRIALELANAAENRMSVIPARVEEYDEETASYTVVRDDNGCRLYYICDEIIPIPHQFR